MPVYSIHYRVEIEIENNYKRAKIQQFGAEKTILYFNNDRDYSSRINAYIILQCIPFGLEVNRTSIVHILEVITMATYVFFPQNV